MCLFFVVLSFWLVSVCFVFLFRFITIQEGIYLVFLFFFLIKEDNGCIKS